MDANLRFVNIIRAALGASLAIFAFIGFGLNLMNPRDVSSTLIYVSVALSIWALSGGFRLRQRFVRKANEILRSHPDDVAAWKRWSAGNIIFYAMCESVALYGLMLRFMGATPAQTIPFFVVAIVGMLAFGPQRP